MTKLPIKLREEATLKVEVMEVTSDNGHIEVISHFMNETSRWRCIKAPTDHGTNAFDGRARPHSLSMAPDVCRQKGVCAAACVMTLHSFLYSSVAHNDDTTHYGWHREQTFNSLRHNHRVLCIVISLLRRSHAYARRSFHSET